MPDRKLLVYADFYSAKVGPSQLLVEQGDLIKIKADNAAVQVFLPDPSAFERGRGNTNPSSGRISISQGTTCSFQVKAKAKSGHYPYSVYCCSGGVKGFAKGNSDPEIIIL
jgi:hypothetical protein